MNSYSIALPLWLLLSIEDGLFDADGYPLEEESSSEELIDPDIIDPDDIIADDFSL